MKPVRVTINGKFMSAHMTGVQRVAMEIVREFDRLISENPSLASSVTLELVAPKSAEPALTTLGLKAIKVRTAGRFGGNLWEQLELPWLAKGSRLLNLCNLGPALSLNAVTMLHDAQVHAAPQSYSVPFRLWYRFIQPWLGHRSRQVLAVSEYSKQDLIKYGVAPTEKITVAHNGVDHVLRLTADMSALDNLKIIPGEYVLALANIQSHKNIKVLLTAFADLPDLKLVLFGRADRAALQGLIEAPLTDNIIPAGPVSDESLSALMSQALCIAFPSRTEGFGLPPLEAMLLGCPAVAAPCGALPEVCGDAALYADPDSPADWVARIRSLKDDPALRQTYSNLGQAKAAHFTWARTARQILELLAS
ncbi:glycosyltransferase family 4 protein [Asticcacaulis machinosus]|uniref:Glycosyltransferase family 1 protein n=1 Tax=Asticcacaulis machinosus TaxID=2984211 RepID=A0ABT5HJP8_9CAUL|nr:glycosyltransferase family 1 protein [Asticcacaulis machinosus]MDC7676462.1 glycosyltransferase family 1 protein [Asticcacaulis machinosus]